MFFKATMIKIQDFALYWAKAYCERSPYMPHVCPVSGVKGYGGGRHGELKGGLRGGFNDGWCDRRCKHIRYCLCHFLADEFKLWQQFTGEPSAFPCFEPERWRAFPVWLAWIVDGAMKRASGDRPHVFYEERWCREGWRREEFYSDGEFL